MIMRNKSKLLNLIFVLIIICLAVFLAINATSCKLFNKDKDAEQAEAQDIEANNDGKKPFGSTFDLGEIIVNLSDTGQARYAKISIVFELKGEGALEEAKSRDPQIRDLVVEMLSSETSEKILSIDERNALKKRIIDKINEEFSTGMVVELYFTNVLVQ